MVTVVGPPVPTGGVYDQLQVPSSFRVTVPSEAVSVTVLRPSASAKVPLLLAGLPWLTVTASWVLAIVGGRSVTLSSVSRKSSETDWPPASVAVTRIRRKEPAPGSGLPRKVPVAGSRLSQAGSAAPLVRVAE